MFKIIVLGIWGLRTRNGETLGWPQIALDYPLSSNMLKCETLSQGPDEYLSDPPLNVWAVVCSQAILDLIEADPNYLVQSSEEIINEAT